MNMYIRRKEAFLIHIGCWGVFRDVDKLMQNLIPLAKCNLALRKFRKDKKNIGRAGHRSPYLIDANDALYHLSYTPMMYIIYNNPHPGFPRSHEP